MCSSDLDLGKRGIAVNSLWPETAIATAAVTNLLGGEAVIKYCRKPEIVADAAHLILTRLAQGNTGNFYIDAQVLADEGIKDLSTYAVDPNSPALLDFFLDMPISSNVIKGNFHPK